MHRTLVLPAFFAGYVLGFIRGERVGYIKGAARAMGNMIAAFKEGTGR